MKPGAFIVIAVCGLVLARALDAAPARGWTVVSMKNDWKRVFHFEPK